MPKIILYGLDSCQAKKISAFRGRVVKPSVDKEVFVEDEPIVSDSSVVSLLRSIYSCKDGELNGELTTFMSEKVRPEVREFIKNQLLKVQTPISSHGLSDDDLSALALKHGDTAESYHERVRTWLESQLPKKEGDE